MIVEGGPFDEHHDLPNTKDRVSRWVKIGVRPNGALLCIEHATSRETGIDLPTTALLIQPDGTWGVGA